MEQCIYQSSTIASLIGGASSGVYHHSRGFVDHCEVVIFINNVKRNIFRRGLEWCALRIPEDGHALAASQLEGSFGGSIAH